MKVVFLGTSGYGVTPARNTGSILLNDHILLDISEGTTRRLLKRGVHRNISHIFLTHGHMDHFIGLFPLLWQYIVVDKRREPLHVTCPSYMKGPINTILEVTHFPLNVQKFPLTFRTLDFSDAGEYSFQIPGYDVKGVVLAHNPPCVGYHITSTSGAGAGKSLAYTGDTRPTPGLESLASGADFLIAECSFPSEMRDLAHSLNHLTPVDSAKIARRANVPRLGLIHHPDYILEHQEAVTREVREDYPDGELVFCTDKLEVTY